jgi:hypothetical protein
MDQEICPLVDSINIINSLDSDLENQLSNSNKEFVADTLIESVENNEEESNNDDVIEQTPESTCDNFVDTNDENVNINSNDAVAKPAKKTKTTTAGSECSDLNEFASRPCQYAIARIKAIMKMDPELLLASKESVYLVAKATVCRIY